MESWFKDLFGTEKPIIAMAHLPALPGTPRYDEALGVEGIVEKLRADVRCLLEAGVDSVMFCNEDDRPYVLTAGLEQVAAMSRIVAELAPRDRPFGVDFLWDAKAAMAIAAATGAAFIREVLTGVYESDMGVWAPSAGELLRYRRQIGAQNVRVFFNIVPEFASPLGTRTLAQKARSVVMSSLPDALLVSGLMAGVAPEPALLQEVKEAVGDAVPVLLNTGARADNIAQYLAVADGAIVGSSLKVNGHTWNPVDPERARAFMAAVRAARGGR